ncbi:MAG: VOC family protein [Dermabacter sp.]|nr:VOC family protein [Dermabacter sp.]
MSGVAGVTGGPRLNAIGIVTSDLAASLEFYRGLGLTIADTPADAPHAEAELEGGLRLMWDAVATVQSFDASYRVPTGSHRVALAFEVDSPERVDSVFASLVAQGATGHVPPFDAVWGQRYAVLHDPDGNAVDLYAALG